MNAKRIAEVAIVVGVLLVAVSALADPLGVGGTDDFGWKQILGVAVGALLAIGGIAWRALGGGGEPAGGVGGAEG